MKQGAWRLVLIPAARTELADLPADMQARFLRVADLLEQFGPQQVGEPHVKHLDGKLWEMRFRGADGIARAVYFAAMDRKLVVVRVFVKKTQATPRRELELAQSRMEAWRNEQ